MANPHKKQRRREAINENRERTHETGETAPHDRSAGNSQVRGDEWRQEHGIDEEHERGRRHGEDDQHHHHHHHHHGEGEQSDRDYERMAEQAHAATEGAHNAPDDRGLLHSGQPRERQSADRRELSGRSAHDQGNPHEGSQRGSHREEGLAGRMTGQRGTSTMHEDVSNSTFRDKTMGEREHRHGGSQGTSERDHRFGSRRGHGSERRTERRHSSH